MTVEGPQRKQGELKHLEHIEKEMDWAAHSVWVEGMSDNCKRKIVDL